MPDLTLHSPRLTLVAVTPQLARAAITDRARVAELLSADLPDAWPQDTIADVLELMSSKLTEDPSRVGWCSWHILLRPSNASARPTVIGNAGVSGISNGWFNPPGPDGRAIVGYGVLPAFERQGFATEATRAILHWAATQSANPVTEFHATTFERHHASRRILEKLGFTLVGVSPDDAQATDSDRQGRGQLLLYKRDTNSV